MLSCSQPDAIIDDTSFTFPFESYRDKDFILLGNATQLRKGQFRCKSPSALFSAKCSTVCSSPTGVCNLQGQTLSRVSILLLVDGVVLMSPHSLQVVRHVHCSDCF